MVKIHLFCEKGKAFFQWVKLAMMAKVVLVSLNYG